MVRINDHTNMTLAVDHGFKALYHNNGYMSLRMTKQTILGATRSDTQTGLYSHRSRLEA